MATYDTLHFETHGALTLVRLNRPDAHTQPWIAVMPPLAAIANKEMVNAAFETGLRTGNLFESRLINGLCATPDKPEK
jgi:hypothetical protein